MQQKHGENKRLSAFRPCRGCFNKTAYSWGEILWQKHIEQLRDKIRQPTAQAFFVSKFHYRTQLIGALSHTPTWHTPRLQARSGCMRHTTDEWLILSSTCFIPFNSLHNLMRFILLLLPFNIWENWSLEKTSTKVMQLASGTNRIWTQAVYSRAHS